MGGGHDDIRIGTLVHADSAVGTIRQILPHGFESFQLSFGHHVGELDLEALAGELRELLAAADETATISALGLYGNPLTDLQTAVDWQRVIDAAPAFGCDVVGGFTGRIPDLPVPESIEPFQKFFTPLAQRAEQRGVRIAFENCAMHGDWQRGDWNIAHAPRAWEMMFDAVPSGAVGLEWEPCHQLVSLVDPLPQLRQWAGRIFHIHGKDASLEWDTIRREGIRSGLPVVAHRTPGFGDTNWTDVISILRRSGYRGAIDIEGWHDPVYSGELEMTGQVHALHYLQQCRGGPFVPNPS
jgi:sugar phosphate isomerase/epimerase